MAGIGFIPILGDGAKAVVDTGGRAIRGLEGLGKNAKIIDGALPGGVPLQRIIADNNVLVGAAEEAGTKLGAASLAELRRADEVFITPNQFNEFTRFKGISRAQRQSRQAFLAAEGINVLDGKAVSELPGFRAAFNAVSTAHGRNDGALVAAAKVTGIDAITLEKRLFNYVTQTLQDPSIPIRRITGQ